MPDFEDPFKSPESTVLRPRPGAGKRGAGEPPPRPAAGASPAEIDAPPVSIESLGIGLSPLVRAATPLLLLTGQLRGTLNGPDIPTLRRYSLDEIRRFEDRARAAGIQNEVVLAARYAICAGLDEAVLSTPWGNQSEWAQQSLLIALHREAYGGEKFFEMLDRISSDPKRHIDLMELQYLCLVFGFAGKFHVADRGQSRLADIQHDLFRRIRDYRGTPPTDLSLRWKGLEDRRNRLVQYVPWWVVGAAALVILAVTYAVYYSLLSSKASPVLNGIDQIAVEAVDDRAQPQQGVTLASLLRAEEAAGRVIIKEKGASTTVRLVGDNLFASGSATINPDYDGLIRRIADALNQVDGSVRVIGHTDNKPFRDNESLATARARSVSDALARTVDRGRLVPYGRGSREPLPGNSSPAQNRRVEIVHIRGS